MQNYNILKLFSSSIDIQIEVGSKTLKEMDSSVPEEFVETEDNKKISGRHKDPDIPKFLSCIFCHRSIDFDGLSATNYEEHLGKLFLYKSGKFISSPFFTNNFT